MEMLDSDSSVWREKAQVTRMKGTMKWSKKTVVKIGIELVIYFKAKGKET